MQNGNRRPRAGKLPAEPGLANCASSRNCSLGESIRQLLPKQRTENPRVGGSASAVDLQRFRENCEKPSTSLDELITMRTNAERKGARKFVLVAEEVLERRFPGWDAAQTQGITTLVSFGSTIRSFPTAKLAYIWLIEQITTAYPGPLQHVDWATDFIAEGRGRLNFARSPEELFAQSPHLAKDKNNYHLLANGWYVNLNLSNDHKFSILCRLAAEAKLQYESDWKWKPR